MKVFKNIAGLLIVVLALYGGYTLVQPKKPVNVLTQDILEELENEGIGIVSAESKFGASGLFNTGEIPDIPLNPSQGSSPNSSLPISLQRSGGIGEIPPNSHPSAPPYGEEHLEEAPGWGNDEETLPDLAPTWEEEAPTWNSESDLELESPGNEGGNFDFSLDGEDLSYLGEEVGKIPPTGSDLPFSPFDFTPLPDEQEEEGGNPPPSPIGGGGIGNGLNQSDLLGAGLINGFPGESPPLSHPFPELGDSAPVPQSVRSPSSVPVEDFLFSAQRSWDVHELPLEHNNPLPMVADHEKKSGYSRSVTQGGDTLGNSPAFAENNTIAPTIPENMSFREFSAIPPTNPEEISYGQRAPSVPAHASGIHGEAVQPLPPIENSQEISKSATMLVALERPRFKDPEPEPTPLVESSAPIKENIAQVLQNSPNIPQNANGEHVNDLFEPFEFQETDSGFPSGTDGNLSLGTRQDVDSIPLENESIDFGDPLIPSSVLQNTPQIAGSSVEIEEIRPTVESRNETIGVEQSEITDDSNYDFGTLNQISSAAPASNTLEDSGEMGGKDHEEKIISDENPFPNLLSGSSTIQPAVDFPGAVSQNTPDSPVEPREEPTLPGVARSVPRLNKKRTNSPDQSRFNHSLRSSTPEIGSNSQNAGAPQSPMSRDFVNLRQDSHFATPEESLHQPFEIGGNLPNPPTDSPGLGVGKEPGNLDAPLIHHFPSSSEKESSHAAMDLESVFPDSGNLKVQLPDTPGLEERVPPSRGEGIANASLTQTQPVQNPLVNRTHERDSAVRPLPESPAPVLGTSQEEPQEIIRPEIIARLKTIREILSDDNQDYREGHRMITELYHAPLYPGEMKEVVKTADKCGWAAFFSRSYFPVLPPYVVRSGDTLDELSAKNRVSKEMIKKINGIKDSDVLYAGRELKIPEGPFNASISISRRELLVSAHGFYACRFKIGIGDLQNLPFEDFRIDEKEKFKNPRYIGEDGEIAEYHKDPRNPLGTHWVGVNGSIGLHGTNDPEILGTDRAPVEGFSMDNKDIAELYDMITSDSIISIRP